MARLGGEDHFLDDGLGIVGILLEVSFEHVAHGLAHRGADFGVAELGLGLALELRLCDFHTHHGRQPFAKIVSTDVKLQFVQHPTAVRIFLQRVGQATTETREVCPAFVRVDVINVRKEVLGERVVVGHGDLDGHAVALATHVDHVLNDGLAVAVEVGHKVL